MSADFPATGGPPEIRASDADRDHVVDVLRVAMGDGRLTADEFGERMEAALSARTLGELAVLTADLVTGTAHAAARAEEVVRIDQKGGRSSGPDSGWCRSGWSCGCRGAM